MPPLIVTAIRDAMVAFWQKLAERRLTGQQYPLRERGRPADFGRPATRRVWPGAAPS
jgi:hypothetical protein